MKLELFLAPVVMDEAAVEQAAVERVFQRGADLWSGRHETKQDFAAALASWMSVRDRHDEASWICDLLERDHGGVVPVTVQEARSWFAGTQEGDDPMPLLFLAGISSKADELVLTQRAASLGNARGQNRYGYLMGQMGQEAEAFRYYELAANSGSVQAVYNMGVMLAHGKGVKECRHTAAELYLKSALKGYQNAQFNLGLYLMGNGMPQVAVFWLRKASETGHAKASFNMGLHYKNEGDVYLAAIYLTRAMRLGHDRAPRKCVLLLPKAVKSVRAMWVLGEALKGRVEDMTVFGVKAGPYVEAARAVVLVRDVCCFRCRAAVMEWLLVARQLQLGRDVSRIVAYCVWASQGDECWYVDVPPLVRVEDADD